MAGPLAAEKLEACDIQIWALMCERQLASELLHDWVISPLLNGTHECLAGLSIDGATAFPDCTAEADRGISDLRRVRVLDCPNPFSESCLQRHAVICRQATGR